MDYNKVIMIGRLTKDVEVKKSKDNVSYVRNDLAVSGRNDQTIFVPVTFYNKTAENLATYCRKGSKIFIDGSYTSGSYVGSDGKKIYTHGIQVVQVQYLDQAQRQQQTKIPQVTDNGDSYSFRNPEYDSKDGSYDLDISSDDLPF